MRTGLTCSKRIPIPDLWLIKWQIVQNLTRRLPPNVDQILDGKKGGKRLVYRLDYFLLIFAYLAAHTVAYLPFTEKAESCFLSQIQLILRLENFASPRASC